MKNSVLRIFTLVFVSLLASSHSAWACTNILVTKGASKDGSTMITYAADSHVLYGELYHWQAQDWPKGSMLEVREWDTNKKLGEIEQIEHTYNVVGNMNEHQLVIAETTFGGRSELQDTTGIMDYGSLIYITLQRAKTAREAIQTMADLVTEYGYYSSGESFSIADKDEVWILEMIGKGGKEKGAVWVAMRIPDGYISSHANQARIQQFPLKDSENCLYSEDVISFARAQGYFDGKDKDFDFSAAYAPVDFGGARFCDARAWSVFNKVQSGFGDQYLDYAMGDVTKERMPLWVKPDHLLSVHDVMELMRDHYEDSPMDMTQDAGAGPNALPYRWRPLTWSVDETTYCNERAISTQQTGFSFVSQSRGWLPDEIGGILWFGVDDTYSTCYTPVYSSSTKIANSFAVGNGDLLTYSNTSAFWIFNEVTNMAYLRYDTIISDIRNKQLELETQYTELVPAIDAAAKVLYKNNPEAAVEFVTKFSVNNANEMVAEWELLRQFIVIKYLDGNVKKEQDGVFLRTEDNYPMSPAFPGYNENWKRQVVDDNGSTLKMPGKGH